MDVLEIYGRFDKEHDELKTKLENYQMSQLKYIRTETCLLDFIINYIEMIVMTMNAEDLKEYIIQQVDPVEIR
jgi:translation elongation factor EF-1beta